MKTFTHSKSIQYENSEGEINWIDSEDTLEGFGDDEGYHVRMTRVQSHFARTNITLSPKEAVELRDDISQYLRRFE